MKMPQSLPTYYKGFRVEVRPLNCGMGWVGFPGSTKTEAFIHIIYSFDHVLKNNYSNQEKKIVQSIVAFANGARNSEVLQLQVPLDLDCEP